MPNNTPSVESAPEQPTTPQWPVIVKLLMCLLCCALTSFLIYGLVYGIVKEVCQIWSSPDVVWSDRTFALLLMGGILSVVAFFFRRFAKEAALSARQLK